MTDFYNTYFEDNLYLLELSTFLEPKSQDSFNYTFQSIDSELATYEQWDTFSDGPIKLLPTKKATTNPGTGIRNTGSTAPTTTRTPCL